MTDMKIKTSFEHILTIVKLIDLIHNNYEQFGH